MLAEILSVRTIHFEVVFASSDVGCLPAMRNSGGGQELDGAEGLPLAGGLTTKITEPG